MKTKKGTVTIPLTKAASRDLRNFLAPLQLPPKVEQEFASIYANGIIIEHLVKVARGRQETAQAATA